MAVELTGFSELIADLAGMAADLDNGPGVDRALQAGAVPVEQQMLANASSDPKSSRERCMVPFTPLR